MTYEVATGFNHANSTTPLSIQPRTTGLQPGRRLVAGDRTVVEDGDQTTALEYGYLTPQAYYDIHNELGLHAAVSNEITITIPDNFERDFTAYNAVVERPRNPRFERGKWLDVAFPLRVIEEAT